jgi:uncharacterized protein (TIGR03118 family)
MNRSIRSVAPAAIAAIAVAGAIAAGTSVPAAAAENAYTVTVLVSNQAGAPITDKNLQNAWGVAFTPAASPFWIADNNNGLATLYDGNGTIVPLVVTIPCPPKAGQGSSCPASAAPTGLVWNPTTNAKTAFLVPGTTIPASFIFDTEDGTISAWAGGLTTNPDTAVLAVDNSITPNAKLGAVYKGLAFGVNESGTFLFATDFRHATIDVFAPSQDASGKGLSYAPATTSGGFKDPGIPAGFAPFGIQNIDGNLIVTYAKQNAAKHDDVAGDGNGYVDAFDTDGHLLQRLASKGGLNSPWGVARASFAFGLFSGDLLIGNFGNSWINALTPTGLVPLQGTNGKPLVVVKGSGLWTLTLGGGAKSNPSILYFTAGPNDEMDGRFGTITPAKSKAASSTSPDSPYSN